METLICPLSDTLQNNTLYVVRAQGSWGKREMATRVS